MLKYLDCIFSGKYIKVFLIWQYMKDIKFPGQLTFSFQGFRIF